MYLKDSYFAEAGVWPEDDDLDQGYLTFALPLREGDDALNAEILKAVANEAKPESFAAYRNPEVSFEEMGDCGWPGYGLDIAFSQELGVALVAYVAPGIPSIVKRYDCSSPDEASGRWSGEAAGDLEFVDENNDEGASKPTTH
jgi:hypothetical protein